MSPGPAAQQVLYGAAPGVAKHQPVMDNGKDYIIKSRFMSGQRRRFDIPAILLTLFVPTLMFMYLSYELSFTAHYQTPSSCRIVNFFTFLLVVLLGCLAFVHTRRKAEGKAEPSWFIILFLTSAIAWLSAWSTGSTTYTRFMQPYYQCTNLKVYPLVDPASTTGQQLMDMGTVMFTPTSRIIFPLTMAFKNERIYCVAPVGAQNGTTVMQNRYDFWAVGTDCCSGHAADFSCGDFDKATAHAGVRVMDDEAMKYYSLAVQQAVSAYNIEAPHPIFVSWVEDPVAEIHKYEDTGFKRYVFSVLFFFAMQFFVVMMAIVIFAKMSHL